MFPAAMSALRGNNSLSKLNADLQVTSRAFGDVESQLKKLQGTLDAKKLEKTKDPLQKELMLLTAKKTKLADEKKQQADLVDQKKKQDQQSSAATQKTVGQLRSVAAAYLQVGAAIVRAGVEHTVHAATDAARFKQDTTFALRFSLGSSKAAAETMGYVQRIADTLGTSSTEAMGQFRELTSMGMGKGESEQLVQLAADLKASNDGQAVALSSLAEPLKALKRGEAVTAASFKGLEDAGMGSRVYDVLADELHIALSNPEDTENTKRQVDKALASLQMRGQKAMDFWSKINLKSLDEKAAGEKAKEFQDTTLTGSFQKIENRWDSLMKAMNSTSSVQAIVDILQKVAAAIDPATDSGQKLLAALDKVAGMAGVYSVASTWTSWSMVSGEPSVRPESFVTALEPLGEGFLEGFGDALSTVTEVIDLFSKGDQTGKGFGDTLRMLGTVLGYFVVGIGAGVGALAYLEAKIFAINAFVLGAGASIGLAIIDGITGGLDSAKAKLIERLEALASLLPDSVRKLLKIQSPSKVMRELGAYAGEGLAIGIESSGGDVLNAARTALVDPVVDSAQAASAAASGGGATSSGGASKSSAQSVTFAPVIHVHASPGMDEEEFARRVQEVLRAEYRRMALELGIVPS